MSITTSRKRSLAILLMAVTMSVALGTIQAAEKNSRKTAQATTGISKQKATMMARPNILAELKLRPQLKTFSELAALAKLDESLGGAGPLTVFAPSDAAFAKHPAAEMASLKADPAKLATFLKGYIVDSASPIKDLAHTGSVKTEAGTTLPVSATGNNYHVGGVKVVKDEIKCLNGQIVILDALLPTQVDGK